MPLQPYRPNDPLIQSYFNDLMGTVQEVSMPLHAGYYENQDHSEDKQITEIHRVENSKASQMVNLNIKQRV